MTGSISLVLGSQSDFNVFEGGGHPDLCHGGTNPESVTGYVEIISPGGLSFAPNEMFIVSVQVKDFSEVASLSILVGFPNGTALRGDNSFFSYNESHYSGIVLDSSGNSTILYYEITAPAIEGNFTLFADAIFGAGGATIEWVHGELEVEIAFPVVAGAPILENLTINSALVEVGQFLNIEVDAFDIQTIISQVLIKYNENNHSMLNTGGNHYEYSNWYPTLEGEKNFWIYAIDTDNNTSILSGSITVIDSVSPQMSSIIQSSDTLELGSEIAISINITDFSGVSIVEIEIEGENYSMINILGDTYSFQDLIPEIIQIYNYTIFSTDMNGNLNSTNSSFEVFILGTPIFKNFIHIVNPLELGEIYSVSIEVTDDLGIDNVWIGIDGGLFHMNNTSGEIWTFKFYPENIGTYIYTIFANDTCGNICTFLDSVMVIDTIPPKILDYTVTIQNSILNATISVIDFSGIKSVEFEFEAVKYSLTKLDNNIWTINLSEDFDFETYNWSIIISDNNDVQNIVIGNFFIPDQESTTISLIKNIYSMIIFGAIGALVVTTGSYIQKIRKNSRKLDLI